MMRSKGPKNTQKKRDGACTERDVREHERAPRRATHLRPHVWIGNFSFLTNRKIVLTFMRWCGAHMAVSNLLILKWWSEML